jgi:hypothetical protein
VAIRRSWRPAGATIVYPFADGSSPGAVAKVGGGARREANALERLGPGARTGSVEVPEVLARVALGDEDVTVESFVSGLPATNVLRGAPESASSLLRDLGRWLRSWNSATAVPRQFGPKDAERHLLGPATRLVPELGEGDRYLARIERLAERCAGAVVPFVAAHNDLTAANLLVGEREGLGVVDWEEADDGCLPLTDLAYAAADLTAAVDRYRDRPGAYATAFGAGGRATESGRLLDQGRGRLGVEPEVAEACLHACWLRHADNERSRCLADGGTAERPFLRILAQVAAGPPIFSP